MQYTNQPATKFATYLCLKNIQKSLKMQNNQDTHK